MAAHETKGQQGSNWIVEGAELLQLEQIDQDLTKWERFE
jgi:hypothetical protein